MSHPAIPLARALLDLGLPRSASAVLGATPLHGTNINRLRARADRHTGQVAPTARVHALGIVLGVGVAVPLRADRGHPDLPVESDTLKSARRLLGDPTLPPLTLVLPDALLIEGASAGLPTLLAFVGRYINRNAAQPVFASAELGPSGSLLPVSQARGKAQAAIDELGDHPGLILLHPDDAAAVAPNPAVVAVAAVEQAVELVFGRALLVDPNLRSLEQLLAECGTRSHPAEALQMLRSYDPSPLPLSDRARYLFELGVYLRHAGDADAAHIAHREASGLLRRTADILGPVQLESMELESIATSVDQFAFGELEGSLRELLQRPFHIAHNQVRCRGLLAQVLSSLGHYREAVALRQANLEQQTHSEVMRAEIPRTLCHLLRDLARLGETSAFDRLARQLLHHPASAPAQQQAYNAWAILFGLVKLDRFEDALCWLRRDQTLWDVPGPQRGTAVLAGADAIEGYPDISIARIVIRALRRADQHALAEAIGQRLSCAGPPLVAWLGNLARSEAAMAMHDRGAAEASSHIRDSARALREGYEPAAAFHHRLVTFAADADSRKTLAPLEREIDAVYY